MALVQAELSHRRFGTRPNQRVSIKKQPPELIVDETPYYVTKMGAAYLGDSRGLLEKVKKESVQLVITSPPFALRRQKSYGSWSDKIDPDSYVKWFLEFAHRIYDVLVPDGSFVVHLGGTWVPGFPFKSLYHHKLAFELCEKIPFHLAQD